MLKHCQAISKNDIKIHKVPRNTAHKTAVLTLLGCDWGAGGTVHDGYPDLN
jgi:hypothetical protein